MTMTDDSTESDGEIESLQRIEELQLEKRKQDYDFREKQLEVMNETVEKIPEIVGETMKQLVPLIMQARDSPELWSPPGGERGKPDFEPPTAKSDEGKQGSNEPEPSQDTREHVEQVRENLGLELGNEENSQEESDTEDYRE